jgi:hypothetical protein
LENLKKRVYNILRPVKGLGGNMLPFQGKKKKLKELKAKAKQLYDKATGFCDASPISNIENYLHGTADISARNEFFEVWKEIQALDPSIPENPFSEDLQGKDIGAWI